MSSNGTKGQNTTAEAARQKKFSIKPFRTHTPMDESHARGIFAKLSRAMEEIHNRNASQLSFEELYRNAYNLVLHKHGALLYDGIACQLSSHLENVASSVAEVPDALLLESIASAWEDHSVTMVMIRDIFMYMDRTYVPQAKKRPVDELGLVLFQQVVWEHPLIQPRVTILMLEAVQQERQGQIAPSFLLKSIVSMLLELGGGCSSSISTTNFRKMDSSSRAPVESGQRRSAMGRFIDDNPNSRNIYERDFERIFLDTTQEFYRLESSSILSQSTASEYVRKATSRLNEELSRSQRYLSPTTEAVLIGICETEWIQTHAKTLVEMESTGFIALLQDCTQKMEELRHMYDLFSRVPNTVDLLRDALANAVKVDGRALLKDQERGVSDSITFIKGILSTRERYSEVVSYAFRGEKKTSKRFKESLEDVLNRDNRAANCLALYADELLKTGIKGITSSAAGGEFFSQAVDAELQNVVIIFRYLQDKDVFENYYKQHLAKRLLTGKSASEEAEKVMVSLLKAECGYQFTSKLEGMFNDMRISRDTRDSYRRYTKSTPLSESEGKGVELEVDVLTTGYWPSQNVPPCILPPQIDEATRKFSAYYLQKHTGRKLSWQTSTGSAEVRATFGDPGKYRRHDLIVTTYQMCILELFNGNETLSLSEIKSKTNIPDAELRRHLISLCTPKHRIIKKASRGKVIADDDSFTFNKDFSSKMKRVKIPLVSMKETMMEDGKGAVGTEDGAAALGELPKEVEEDRRHLVEAVVMRIMKARKTLHHNELIAEVTRQLQVRFLPRPQFIKKRVESLIERDYLERSDEDRRIYVYLA